MTYGMGVGPHSFYPPSWQGTAIYPSHNRTSKWLQRLTTLLQNAQRALYGVRHIELLSERRATTAATVIAHRRQRPPSRTRTLYQAWKLQYTRPSASRRKHVPAPPMLGTAPVALTKRLNALTTKWVQHSRSISHTINAICIQPTRQRYKHPRRDEHRTTKLKLCKLQHILRISR